MSTRSKSMSKCHRHVDSGHWEKRSSHAVMFLHCFALMHGPINLQVGVPVVDQSHPTSHPQHNPTKIKSRMSEYVLYTTDTSANSVKDGIR